MQLDYLFPCVSFSFAEREGHFHVFARHLLRIQKKAPVRSYLFKCGRATVTSYRVVQQCIDRIFRALDWACVIAVLNILRSFFLLLRRQWISYSIRLGTLNPLAQAVADCSFIPTDDWFTSRCVDQEGYDTQVMYLIVPYWATSFFSACHSILLIP